MAPAVPVQRHRCSHGERRVLGGVQTGHAQGELPGKRGEPKPGPAGRERHAVQPVGAGRGAADRRAGHVGPLGRDGRRHVGGAGIVGVVDQLAAVREPTAELHERGHRVPVVGEVVDVLPLDAGEHDPIRVVTQKVAPVFAGLRRQQTRCPG